MLQKEFLSMIESPCLEFVGHAVLIRVLKSLFHGRESVKPAEVFVIMSQLQYLYL